MAYRSTHTGPQIDDAVDKVLGNVDQQMLAPILSDPAGQAVTAGQYFIYNDVLRKAVQGFSASTTAATFTGATYSTVVSNGAANDLKSALKNVETIPFDLASGIYQFGEGYYEPATGRVSIIANFYGAFSNATPSKVATIPAKYVPSAGAYGPCVVYKNDTGDTFITYCGLNAYTGTLEQAGTTFNGGSNYTVLVWLEYYI